jgi:putative hydrolase of the HAD superfamily
MFPHTPYRHLFFDLDHTIWDFETNARITLEELFGKYQLERYFIDFGDFFSRYTPINRDLWAQYQRKEVPKSTLKVNRFYNTFRSVGFDDFAMATNFGNDFIASSPLQTTVMPHTFELLDYLQERRYQMHIITNGFTETQHKKLERSGLRPYFQKLFISEEIGVSKPHKRFFEYAIKSTNARKKESLVIGDSLENDVKGARNFGLDHIYLNPRQISHNEAIFKEISSLEELIGWL